MRYLTNLGAVIIGVCVGCLINTTICLIVIARALTILASPPGA